MPQLIEHIDAMSRRKQRDVLFVIFNNPALRDEHDDLSSGSNVDWKNSAARQELLSWLDEQGIGWQPCGPFANVNSISSYQGQVYVDVPYEKSLPAYQALEAFLENPDGTMRLFGARFCYLPLEQAMKNAAHDEPGFWDRWADTF